MRWKREVGDGDCGAFGSGNWGFVGNHRAVGAGWDEVQLRGINFLRRPGGCSAVKFASVFRVVFLADFVQSVYVDFNVLVNTEEVAL